MLIIAFLLLCPFALHSAFSIRDSALPAGGLPTVTLKSVGSLPAHIAGSFQEFAACHVTPEGDYLVFDRRAHSVYRVARDGASAPQKILQIGVKKGEILQPIAFGSAPDGTFVVADSPVGQDSVQIFL